MTAVKRSSLSITISVWRALLLREALTRISGRRAPWLWLLLEPIFHISVLAFMMNVIRHRVVGGIDAMLWTISGLLAFFFFRRTATQSSNAINSNAALFAYRQVRPVDTVMVRAILELGLMLIISITVCILVALIDIDVFPQDPILLFQAVFCLWLFGLGVGLVFSVANELIPEVNQIFKFVMMPVYLASGVVFPISMVPIPYRNWLLFNPVVHGVEATRQGFSSYYHVVSDIDLSYLLICAIFMVFFGLVLHVRFIKRLISK